jgi:uridine kinase
LYRRWLEDRFEQWSSALDVIIWLDAPEELCLQRVLARKQWHDAKAMPSDDVLSRFRRLRSSYEQIIDTMVSRQPKKVFHFRTDQVSTEEMVEQIVSEVNLAPRSQAHTGPKINNSALHTSC